jgi:hypothetical protein
MLGDGQGDPLARRLGKNAAPQLGTHAGVRAKDGRGTGEDTDELGDRATSRLDGLDERGALIGRRQLVVNLESAYCRFNRHLLLVSGLLAGSVGESALQSLYVAFTLL